MSSWGGKAQSWIVAAKDKVSPWQVMIGLAFGLYMLGASTRGAVAALANKTDITAEVKAHDESPHAHQIEQQRLRALEDWRLTLTAETTLHNWYVEKALDKIQDERGIEKPDRREAPLPAIPGPWMSIAPPP